MYRQIQSWPTPELFINGIPSASSFLTYDAPTCREDIIFTIPSLKANTIYALQVSASAGGPFTNHIEFALLTLTEQATKTKVLRLNNDYAGNYYFQLARTYTIAGPENTVIATAVKPLASVIAAPVIAIANLSDITQYAVSLIGPGTNNYNVKPLVPLLADIGGLRPYSGTEDPLCWNSSRYLRPKRKYAGRYNNINFQQWGDLSGAQSINNGITLTGTGTSRYTINGGDPAEDTAQYAYDGVPNNAYATSPAFSLVIRARSFSGSCRSPLAVVVVDKVSPELLYTQTNIRGNNVVGYCDLAKTVNGNVLLGGSPCDMSPPPEGTANAFRRMVDDTALLPSGIPSGAPNPTLYNVGYTVTTKQDYTGFINYIYATNGVIAQSFVWHRTDINGWSFVANSHVYSMWEDSGDSVVVPNKTPQKQSDPYNFPWSHVVGEYDNTAFNANTQSYINALIINDGGTPASLWPLGVVTVPMIFSLTLARFDMVQTAYYAPTWSNFVAALVVAITGGGIPPALPPTPGPLPPDPNLLLNIEPWDEYALTANADAATLNLGDGWAASAWVVVTFLAAVGYETWESYTLGNIVAVSGTYYSGPDATQTPLTSGDGFTSAGWVVPPSANSAGIDDFESYALGVMDSYNFNGGTGFASAYVVWPQNAGDGFDDFESWPVGVIDATILLAHGTSGQGMGDNGYNIWIL